MRCVIRNSINSESLAHVIEEHVTGFSNGGVKIHDAMPRGLAENVTFELPSIEDRVCRTICRETCGRDFVLEHGGGHDDFEDGTGRELRLNRTIQQRLTLVIVELLPFLIRDANREIIGIWSRMADHSQNLAAARIERYHRAIASAQRLLRDLLQVVIDGELNLLARDSFLGRQVVHFFADAVHHHSPHAVRALQQIIILTLEAGFAHEVAGPEASVAGFDLLLADFAHVPARVRHESARQIPSPVHHQHFQQRYVGTVRIDERDIRLAGFWLDDDRLKILQVARGLQLLPQITQRNIESLGDGRKTLFHLCGIVAKQKNAEGWIVVYQDAAIAIQHAATWRNHWNGANPVTLRPLQKLIGVNNLELPETDEQHADHSHNDVGDDGQPL